MSVIADLENIYSTPLAPTETNQAPCVVGALEAGLPETAGRRLVGENTSNSNFSVDPLAYYCALVLVAGMDEMVTGGGYCRIGARRYCELDETIRAWNWLEAEGLAG